MVILGVEFFVLDDRKWGETREQEGGKISLSALAAPVVRSKGKPVQAFSLFVFCRFSAPFSL